MAKQDKQSFEQKLEKIKEIVNLLENEETELENMLGLYEEAMKLSKECRTFLEKAEQKVIEINEKYNNESELF